MSKAFYYNCLVFYDRALCRGGVNISESPIQEETNHGSGNTNSPIKLVDSKPT
jgi:hypothetical protein